MVAIVLTTMGSGPASARCLGPQLSYDAVDLRGGDTLTVTGTGYGSACYDGGGGSKPAGEGALGKPMTDIEVWFAQGDERIVVAQGVAEDDYGFTVDIVVPAGLKPGKATIGSTAYQLDLQPITITDEAQDGQSEVASFGPAAEPPTPPTASNSQPSDDQGGVALADVAAGMALLGAAAVGAGVAVLRRR